MITIRQGDITQAQVDAIVNAANHEMLGGGGVDGAIHRAAGPELRAQCQQVKCINGQRCPTGEVRITGAGQLSARYIIHTVGPIYKLDDNPALHLQQCYQRACEQALELGIQSIAFPAIACGVYGYPHQEAAHIALTTVSAFTDLEIYFYLYDASLYRVFTDIWQTHKAS